MGRKGGKNIALPFCGEFDFRKEEAREGSDLEVQLKVSIVV